MYRYYTHNNCNRQQQTFFVMTHDMRPLRTPCAGPPVSFCSPYKLPSPIILLCLNSAKSSAIWLATISRASTKMLFNLMSVSSESKVSSILCNTSSLKAIYKGYIKIEKKKEQCIAYFHVHCTLYMK